MLPASNINLVCEKTLDLTGFRKNLPICIFKSVPQKILNDIIKVLNFKYYGIREKVEDERARFKHLQDM